MTTNPQTASVRLRTYLRLLPDAHTLGGEIAYSEEFRSEDWPRSCYAPTREDVEALLAVVPSAPVDRAELRDRIAAAMREHWLCTIRDEADADGNLPCRCGDWREPGAEVDDENDWDSHLADVALAFLPAPVDRGAVLREAADAPAAECSAQHHRFDDGRLCIRAAQHRGDHIDERGFHWSDTVAMYPLADGTFRTGVNLRAELRRMADEEQPEKPDRCPHGCDTSTCPCLACEADEEQQPETVPGTVSLTRNQLAALLAHHADVLAANLRTDARTGLPDHRTGVDRAAGLLGLHAERLTADEETPAVAELLDSILTFPGDARAAVAQPGKEADADRIVAYRSDGGRSLNCLRHIPPPAARHADFHPVTSEDLPDGGICTFPDCGVDVLITPGKEA